MEERVGPEIDVNKQEELRVHGVDRQVSHGVDGVHLVRRLPSIGREFDVFAGVTYLVER